jgi:hypothetical protein
VGKDKDYWKVEFYIFIWIIIWNNIFFRATVFNDTITYVEILIGAVFFGLAYGLFSWVVMEKRYKKLIENN